MITNDKPSNWWKKQKQDLFKDVFQYVHILGERQSYRESDNLRYMRLYGNFETVGLSAHQYAKFDPSYGSLPRVTLNVIQSMVDTVVSKITKSRPKVTFLTEGGDWSLQTKAKKLTQFIEGQFYASNYYQEVEKAFLDMCIMGTGCVKIYNDGTNICAERTLINEIIVDDAEAYYGRPRQMLQTKYIHRDVIKDMFPEDSSFIDSANKSDNYYSQDTQNNDDMIMVVESWHLPSGKNAKDGRHAISISNRTLMEEEYTKDYFPFIFIKWNLRPLGFFGQGLAEQLQGLQLEINKILKTIQISMHLTSIPKVFVEASSKVVTAHLDNRIGSIIKYVGTKPSYESVSAIPQDLYQHLDRLYNRAFEIAGISQLSAQSAKPSGLDSGRALREFYDIESERFQAVSKRYQDSFLDAAAIFVDLSKDLYEQLDANGEDFAVQVKGDKFIKTINWKDIDLAEDKYMMHMFPTSMLSSTPSGKLADVQELIQAGMIPAEYGPRLLDFPDLEAYQSREEAHIDDIERAIELIVEDGQYETPEPYQDLRLGIKLMQQAYLLYRTQKLPEEKLDLFRRWMADANELLIKAATPAEMPADPNQYIPETLPPMPGEVPLDPNQAPIDPALAEMPIDPNAPIVPGM